MPGSDWQLWLCVGSVSDDDIPESSPRLVNITPASGSLEDAAAAVDLSGVTSADFRSEVGVVFGEDVDVPTAVLAYVAAWGAAAKPLPFRADGEVVSAATVYAMAQRLAVPLERPLLTVDQVQVGEAAHPDVPSVVFRAAASTEDLTAVRFARRIRFVPGTTITAALSQLLVVAGLRVRGDDDRLPWLCDGSEPVTDGVTQVGVCLDSLRRETKRLRQSERNLTGDRTALVPPAPSKRLHRLTSSVNIDMAVVMRRLGARQDPLSGMWHCPRPKRHTNGDATASMRVNDDGTVRCFRCDGERVDALRLVADVTRLSPDDAALWLRKVAELQTRQTLDSLFT